MRANRQGGGDRPIDSGAQSRARGHCPEPASNPRGDNGKRRPVALAGQTGERRGRENPDALTEPPWLHLSPFRCKKENRNYTQSTVVEHFSPQLIFPCAVTVGFPPPKQNKK